MINEGVEYVMREGLGVEKNEGRKNVIWELDECENKWLGEKKEVV